MTYEKREKVWQVIETVGYMLMGVLLALAMYAIGRKTAEQQALADTQSVEQVANGMPLDAIQYPAPSWMPDARQVFEVTDRKNNAKWWVIQTADQQWITLQIGEYQDAG